MKQLFLLYVLLSVLLTSAAVSEEKTIPSLSTSEEVASSFLEKEDSIGGVLSPLSGQLSLMQTDLVAQGAQPVWLTRTYLQHLLPCGQDDRNLFSFLKHNYKGWTIFPHHYVLNVGAGSRLRVTQPNGVVLDFSLANRRDPSVFQLEGPYVGICNAIHEEPSGKYDLRNSRIKIYADGKFIIQEPNGVRRYYKNLNNFCYVLEKEQLSNGKILKYTYNHLNDLSRIESQDPKERYTYASIDISGSPKEGKQQFIVSSLSLPAGPENQWQSLYTMSYFPPVIGQHQGTTTVYSSGRARESIFHLHLRFPL